MPLSTSIGEPGTGGSAHLEFDLDSTSFAASADGGTPASLGGVAVLQFTDATSGLWKLQLDLASSAVAGVFTASITTVFTGSDGGQMAQYSTPSQFQGHPWIHVAFDVQTAKTATTASVNVDGRLVLSSPVSPALTNSPAIEFSVGTNGLVETLHFDNVTFDP